MDNLLKSAVAISLFFFTVALTGTAARAEGGMSGGGGNVIASEAPQRPAPVDLTAKIVRHAFGHVVPYLSKMKVEIQKGRNVPDCLRELLDAKADVVSIAEKNPPKIIVSAPCFDENQVPFDATNYAAANREVCVSALRIAQRLTKNEIESQAVALLVHEYAELAGFSDEEAIAIQKAVLADFRN